MKKVNLLFLTLMVVVLGSISSVNAQEWSAEQKDVWAGVEKYWAASASGDAQAFLVYFDENYKGWDNQSVVPQNKSNTSKWIEFSAKTNKTLVYTLSPQTIWVKGDFAYVHYFYNEVDKNTETGKNERNSGKWTDILMKKDGKWMLVGDHGGRTLKDQ
jgi:ketosteroid isomerase-like protein